MRRSMKVIATASTMALFSLIPLTAVARDSVTDTVRAEVVEEAPDQVTDRPADRHVDQVRDPVRDRQPVLDRRTDRVIDREVDRPIDRCHPRIADNLRRCLHDEWPHDINVRHLIWRLINAHEWEKLVRLLHWLGWL